jgi:hypothetical protein
MKHVTKARHGNCGCGVAAERDGALARGQHPAEILCRIVDVRSLGPPVA